MTTIEATAPGQVAVGNRQRDTSSHGARRRPMPLAAVALAAALTGGVIGAATAIAAPTLTRDHAAEQARWKAFVVDLEEAIRRDDRWQLMHPVTE